VGPKPPSEPGRPGYWTSSRYRGLCRGRSYLKYYLSNHKNGPFRRSGLLHSLAMFTTTDPTRPLNLMRPSHSVLASLLPQYSPSQIPSAKPETCCCLLRANKVTTLPCKLKLLQEGKSQDSSFISPSTLRSGKSSLSSWNPPRTKHVYQSLFTRNLFLWIPIPGYNAGRHIVACTVSDIFSLSWVFWYSCLLKLKQWSITLVPRHHRVARKAMKYRHTRLKRQTISSIPI
jgi:hypothetical protein